MFEVIVLAKSSLYVQTHIHIASGRRYREDIGWIKILLGIGYITLVEWSVPWSQSRYSHCKKVI